MDIDITKIKERHDTASPIHTHPNTLSIIEPSEPYILESIRAIILDIIVNENSIASLSVSKLTTVYPKM